jgi:adenosine kinase
MTIACTGSIAYDYLMSYPGHFIDHILPDHLETISLSFLVDTLVRQRGGTAPNIAYTLAMLGEIKPLLVGTAGIDFDEYRSWLEKMGVDTHFVQVIEGEYTASFFANTDLSNNQICSFYSGAMRNAAQIKISDMGLTSHDLVVISPNDPCAMDMYAIDCKKLGIPYVYDPGQQVARSDPAELRRGTEGAHCLFVNEYEYQLLQKHTGLTEADILRHVDFLVVTLAEKGSCIYVKDRQFYVQAVYPDHIADPTGVGDAYRAGFLRGYKLGFDWVTCGQMGSLAASYCLEMKGGQTHTFTIPEYVNRYRHYFKDHGKLDRLIN